ncbi:protein kinase [Clostridium oryzae]|uniref:Protein kinase n=1 Tax=Clostridium oryzae TaxID=1450648 RepID=A0A1V4ISH7_9CLOT|nr:protein kinase [Clostridium oryzae]OPJ62417.1 hypothetical protein CLORY_17860 [Clostridium oryzae]
MKDDLYKKYIIDFQVNLLTCKSLGKGHNGIVYMLPEKKVIKICFSEKSCRNEYYILKRINNNKYFPRVYGMSGNYMIRDFVDGITLKDYIKKNGLDKGTAVKVIGLLKEFKKLKFKKYDIRCKDIMVTPDNTLMVIDPKKCFSKSRNYPQHLCKGLYNLGALDIFLNVLHENSPELYKKWNDKICKYISTRICI